MTKRTGLFINADDFCLSDSITNAIVELSAKGKIDSTSVVVNNDLLNLKENLMRLNNFETGLHLNLCEGKPVTEIAQVKSLVNNEGIFYNYKILCIRYIIGLVKKSELFLEITNQYKLLEKYTKVSHVDSHKHIHCYPFIGENILKCLHTIGVMNIRNPYPVLYKQKKYLILRCFCSRRRWRKLVSNFNTPEGLISIYKLDNLSDVMEDFKHRNLEIMAHPSIENEGGYLDNNKEFNILLNR
ncbi:MAG: hypothetical protein C0596_12825 [Marinilabiliales bacterium]|nr:MAG: hypothetical protein C0596_12825 [Marinilabiliales bacterium]